MTLGQTWAYKLFSSVVWGIPVQILWAIAFVVFSVFLYRRHRFGVQVHAVGDNPDSAQQMGINVRRVRVLTFVFVGFGAACAGVFSTMINYTWWPTSGDGYLLPVLASVFVGGTPTWGGIGTVSGGAIGALTVSFIQTGIVGAGLSGFYVQFFNGLIIILSLLGHRWNQSATGDAILFEPDIAGTMHDSGKHCSISCSVVSGEKVDTKGELPACEQRLDAIVETAETDQTARIAVSIDRRTPGSPRSVVAEVARTLVGEGSGPFLGQFPRKVGDLLVVRIVVDGEVERQHRREVAGRRIVVERRRESWSANAIPIRMISRPGCYPSQSDRMPGAA